MMNPTRNGFPLFQFPNILSPALAGKFLLLLFLFLIVCFLIIRQYHILENQIKLTAFFKHAAEILPLGNDEALPVGMRQIPVELKHIRGDAREEIHRHLPWVAEKLYQDPFPASEAASYLPIYFGYTKHPVPLESELIDPSQPAWFTWSAGPSRIPPEIEIQSATDDFSTHIFHSPVYHPSNGITSYGYLYRDSRGLRLGN